jgi:hypothetical protein
LFVPFIAAVIVLWLWLKSMPRHLRKGGRQHTRLPPALSEMAWHRSNLLVAVCSSLVRTWNVNEIRTQIDEIKSILRADLDLMFYVLDS